MENENKNIVMIDPQGVYNEGGRGKKKCNCGKFVGARVSECPACHFKFQIKSSGRDLITSNTSTIDTSTSSGGKGKKQCPNCKNFTGVRSRICTNCNHLFSSPVIAATKLITGGIGVRVIHTPAGICPIKLYGTSFEEVSEWANKVMVAGAEKNLRYLPPALKYFLRHSFELFSEEWNQASLSLGEWVNVNIVSPIQRIEN